MFRLFDNKTKLKELEEEEINELFVRSEQLVKSSKEIMNLLKTAKSDRSKIDEKLSEEIRRRLRIVLRVLHEESKIAKKALKTELNRQIAEPL